MSIDVLSRVLVVAANPSDTSQLRLAREVREIIEELKRSRFREKFDVEQRGATRIKDLRRAMLDTTPRFVHFSGHGADEGLAFEDDDDLTHTVEPEALEGLFELFTGEVECVLLNACYSAPQAKAISQHIDYVIGMRTAISDDAAIEFAVGFYAALGAGRSIEDAYRFGCNAIHLKGIPEHLTPVMHVRSTKSPVRDEPSAIGTRPGEMGRSGQPIEIFYSYSHGDEGLRNQLETHLSVLKRLGLITNWHDRRIGASREWEGEISRRLDSAQIILLLVSADFLASDYIYDLELKRAMERHEKEEARVIPIILRPCDWNDAPFSKLQALPQDAMPVTTWADWDEAFTNVAKGIRSVVEEMRSSV